MRITFDFEEQDRELAKYLAERSSEIMKEMGADHVDYLKDLGPYEIMNYQSTHNTGGVTQIPTHGGRSANGQEAWAWARSNADRDKREALLLFSRLSPISGF